MLAALGSSMAGPWLPGCAAPEPLLRVATNVWPGYETLYLARSLGRYDPHRVRLIEMPSNTESLRALAAGTIEGAALTLDEMLSARADGIDLVAILVFDVSNGADALMARRSIPNLAALAGQRIAVEQTAVGALMLDAVLRAGRLTPNQVRPVFLTVERHLAAYDAGEVDAVVTFEPVLSELANRGAVRLFDSHQLPGAIVDVLALQRGALHERPLAVRQLLAGHFRALNYLQQHPLDAARRMAPRLQLSPAAILQSYQGLQQPDLSANRAWLGGAQARLPQSAAQLQPLMLRAKLLEHPVPLNQLCEAIWLPKADEVGA
jgi:NitT/TauT family transport system substrate-binding protein